ncbi:MAG: phasin family protein [Roseiflexaceae bacterium]|nr:phasin family protein [Roseiflexaceae bacterium]
MTTRNNDTIDEVVETTAAAVASASDKATDKVEATEKRAHKAVKHAAAQASDVVETVEVKVNEAVNSTGTSSAWLIDGFRRLMLASVGAVAMTIDEAEGLVDKLVDRGELAQKDGQKLLKDLQSRVSGSRPIVPAQVEKVGDRIEQGVEEVLSRLNIPSKRDIEELSSRIAQLTARVEELKKK